jgi:putative resolvase
VASGIPVVTAVSEVGSGMNGSRPKLRKLLANPEVTMVVVEHRDRLGRMNTELDDDLARDMTEVLTSFCARLYGRRNAAKRAAAAVSSQDR